MFRALIVCTTTNCKLRWYKVVEASYKTHQSNKLLQISDMPGIPELVAFDRSELSKAEVKHVMREIKKQFTNKTVSMKKGYMDIYLPNIQAKYRNKSLENSDVEKSLLNNCRVVRCSDFINKNSDRVGNVTQTDQEKSGFSEDADSLCTDMHNDTNMSVCTKNGCDESDISNDGIDTNEEKNATVISRKRKAAVEGIGGPNVKMQRVEINNKNHSEEDGKFNFKFNDSMEQATASNVRGFICKICDLVRKKFNKQSGDKNDRYADIIECKHGKNVKNSAASKRVRKGVKSFGEKAGDLPHVSQYVAMDCEFVGVGDKGRIDYLGRCSIVNFDGEVIYDKYCKPDVYVTDYRTRYSGLKPYMLSHRGKPLHVLQEEISSIIKGKIVIGHAVHNDFRVLKILHPKTHIRDTNNYKTLTNMSGTSSGLKRLTKELLNREIQKKSHCSVEDATATLDLFKLVRLEWETNLKGRNPPRDTENDTSFLNDEFWMESEDSDDSQK